MAQARMRTSTAIVEQCSRSVMFANDEYPEVPYSLAGSCFVFRYGSGYYMATARHVVTGRAPEDLQVHTLKIESIATCYLNPGQKLAGLKKL